MTGDEEAELSRACDGCGELLPAGRSVCPSCGTLQSPRFETTAETPVATTPPEGPRTPVAPPASGFPVASGSSARRSPWKVAVVIIVALACLAGAAVVGRALLTDDGDGGTAAPATSTTTPSKDARVNAIRGYCADPRPLTKPGPIAAFTPGEGTVAFVEVPRVASSTEPTKDLVAQVSPVVGSPDLELEPSVGLLSLAVCLDQTSAKATGATCTFELTDADHVGDRRSADLLETTYDVRLLELRTGKPVVEGKLTTSVDHCPERAYLDQEAGVSNSLTGDQILTWVAINLVDGRPR